MLRHERSEAERFVHLIPMKVGVGLNGTVLPSIAILGFQSHQSSLMRRLLFNILTGSILTWSSCSKLIYGRLRLERPQLSCACRDQMSISIVGWLAGRFFEMSSMKSGNRSGATTESLFDLNIFALRAAKENFSLPVGSEGCKSLDNL